MKIIDVVKSVGVFLGLFCFFVMYGIGMKYYPTVTLIIVMVPACLFFIMSLAKYFESKRRYK